MTSAARGRSIVGDVERSGPPPPSAASGRRPTPDRARPRPARGTRTPGPSTRVGAGRCDRPCITATTGLVAPAVAVVDLVDGRGRTTSASGGAWTTMIPSTSGASTRRPHAWLEVRGCRLASPARRGGSTGSSPAVVSAARASCSGLREFDSTATSRAVRAPAASPGPAPCRAARRPSAPRSARPAGTGRRPVGPTAAAPVRTATIGRCRDTRRAMRANLRGLPNVSVYMAMTRVVSSSSQNCSRSLPETSPLSPSDTNHDSPMPSSSARRNSEAPSEPDCIEIATGPGGRIDGHQRALQADRRARRRDAHAAGPDDPHAVAAGSVDQRTAGRRRCRRRR